MTGWEGGREGASFVFGSHTSFLFPHHAFYSLLVHPHPTSYLAGPSEVADREPEGDHYACHCRGWPQAQPPPLLPEPMEDREERVLAMLGIVGTILNLVIIFIYIYTTIYRLLACSTELPGLWPASASWKREKLWQGQGVTGCHLGFHPALPLPAKGHRQRGLCHCQVLPGWCLSALGMVFACPGIAASCCGYLPRVCPISLVCVCGGG